MQLEVVVFGSLIFCRYLLLLLFNFLSEYIQFTGGIILFLLHELVGGTSSLLCFADREGSRIRVFRLFRL